MLMPVSRRGWPNCWRPCSSLPLATTPWQYLQRRGHLAIIGPFISWCSWAGPRVYLGSRPSPPNPNSSQAVAVTCADVATRDDLTARQCGKLSKTLQRHGGELWLSDALQLCKTTSATLETSGHRRFAWVVEPAGKGKVVAHRPQPPPQTADQPKALTPAQATALEGMSNPDRGAVPDFAARGHRLWQNPRCICRPLPPAFKAGTVGAGAGARNWPPPPSSPIGLPAALGTGVCIYHSALIGRRTAYDTWRQNPAK